MARTRTTQRSTGRSRRRRRRARRTSSLTRRRARQLLEAAFGNQHDLAVGDAPEAAGDSLADHAEPEPLEEAQRPRQVTGREPPNPARPEGAERVELRGEERAAQAAAPAALVEHRVVGPAQRRVRLVEASGHEAEERG